jgi:hypothetical protein
MEYKITLPLFDAYDFLYSNGLEQECGEIRNSSDQFKSYTSSVRRAKIIKLVRDKYLFYDFCKIVYPFGLTDKGKMQIKFYENILIRFHAQSRHII